jgi:protein SCO1
VSQSKTADKVACLVVLGLILLLTSCTSSQPTLSRAEPDPGGYRGGTSVPEPYELPEATLTDTFGNSYNLANSPSKPVVLLFFGYTHCPDVCVTVLADVAQALNRLAPEERDSVQMIFITTDPARDTPPVIGKYLERFDPSFLGLTGDLTTIKSVATRVGVHIEGRRKLPSGGYEVGHSAQVIGFDRDRKGVVIWTPETPIGDLKHDFALLVERSR